MKKTIAILVGFFLASVGFGMEGRAGTKQQKQQQFAEEASIKEINNKSEAFLGQRVQIEGEVEDIVVAGQSFILEGDTWTDNEILVVSKGRIVNLNEMADEDRRVRLVGTVKHANFYEIENDLKSGINPEVEMEKEKGVTYILLDSFQSAGMLSE